MRHISTQFSLQRVAVIQSGLPRRCLAVSIGKSGKKIRPLPFLSVLAHVSRSFGADASCIQGRMDPHAYTALPIAAARAISTERNGGIQVLHVYTHHTCAFVHPKKGLHLTDQYVPSCPRHHVARRFCACRNRHCYRHLHCKRNSITQTST